MTLQIRLTQVFVNDQDRAKTFYTETLGFLPKHDVPAGGARWITVVSAADPDGAELLLEPNLHPASQAYTAALLADGIPAAQFAVDDVPAEYDRLSALGVRFTQEPTAMGPVTKAVLDDTCGNLVQLMHYAG